MPELKTSPNNNDVIAFLESIEHDNKKADAYCIFDMMKDITKSEPVMWGNSIIGFGSYHYVYDSGREGNWFLTGFSPRKQHFSLYIMSGFAILDEELKKLGKYKTGKGCLYINKLDDVDLNVLKQLIQQSVSHLQQKYPGNTLN